MIPIVRILRQFQARLMYPLAQLEGPVRQQVLCFGTIELASGAQEISFDRKESAMGHEVQAIATGLLQLNHQGLIIYRPYT